MTFFHLAGPSLVVVLLFLLSTPITWALAIGALTFFFLNMDMIPLSNFAQEMAEGSQSVSLLALPLFVLAGCIMNASGITRRLLTLADVLVGHMTGALAQMCTVLATLLGGLTASANADAAMLAKTLGIQMAERGYSRAFAAVITSSAAIITSLIPPSIGLIVYGFLAETSIGRLFAAGVVPGLVLALGLMITTHFIARKRGYRSLRDRRATGAEMRTALVDGLWALSIPVVIFVGTRYGLFTTTEAGAVVVVYVLFVAIFGYREFTVRQIPEVLAEAVRDSAVVMVMICAAAAFGFYLAWEQVPQAMSGWLGGATSNPLVMLLLINVMLLVIGTAIEGSAALIILTPMLIPIIDGVHIDRVHFGIIFITNLTIAGITPPVGGLMYISSMVMKVPMMAYAREVLPYLAMMMVLLSILSIFPQLSLWLPNLIYGTAAVQ
ncbi:tripartite ATP-independent transporter DctM subunit [Rhizobium sp. PP-F2F-G38]|uniref:TRAP transporter large permease protein n=1 Tax=Ferranicluibacter rubi TaxID=2715133 RepID=A0AA43ZHU5_9HYPH|nr:TRAP transporter large permease [Ferranicluibacter rubi]PYE34096.1 tripartite ATP-independent transporter DctM subunit [Rhizobium sp. PP-WC-1G-195]PYE96732.1 tripartite ATP-independent transporter DctM subunit [Rhizobium sp. PP-F2F-G38]TCP86144.1 tripartite ATP-independent transporter DctM subunit [Rhizobium sp. PP-CC-2G-626]TCQ23583.1 tripartite ATP-independent transporter DctM subunit [Rhizobium sp. PP-CC-3G-465]NHT77310.1 TRAP transporter large permease [Ferranicluibacter rubi]